MFNINRNIIAKILIFFALVILLPLIWNALNPAKPTPGESKDISQKTEIMEFLTQLNERWISGDREGLHQKGELICRAFSKTPKDTPKEFFECNPTYLNCFLEQKKISKQFVFLKKNNNYIGKVNTGTTVVVKDTLNSRVFSVLLENHCHEKFLPKNNYMAGSQISDEYKWDNFLYDIYIDKYYVSINDLKPNSDKDLSQATTDITLSAMKNFCESKGNILLENRYFDAATFYPSSNKVIYKHPYPWTKSRKSFLSEGGNIKVGNCQNAFVKGCIEYVPFHNKSGLSLSWIGIDHSLGSLPEVFRNTFNPRANLKVSSLYLEKSSSWHRLGLRGNWSGEDFVTRSFDMVDQYSNRLINISDSLKGVAFRCARLK